VNFFIVGGQRCGTTWLYHMLDQHPEIEMARPLKPEPKYFLRNKAFNKDEYLNLYSHQNIALGEKSTSYYEKPEVALRIKDSFPNAKILFLARNPIDRAISNYFFSKNNGLETRTLEEVFLENRGAPMDAFDCSVNPFNYITRSLYSKYIKTYIEVFGEENVLVICTEKIVSQISEYKKVLNFLNVDNEFEPAHYANIINSAKTIEKESLLVRRALREEFLPEITKLKSFIDTTYWKEFLARGYK